MVAHLKRRAGSDLELPLSRHNLSVDAADHDSSLEARAHVLFDQFAAVDLICANAAVVRTLFWRIASVVSEAEGPGAVKKHVLLLHAEPCLLVAVVAGHEGAQRCAGVGCMGSDTIGVEHFTHGQHMITTANRVWDDVHWTQHAV